ncbi:MAG: hypothetical protein C7B44_00275 [Sulfobacillus thermosulfidooxidans]|nr:MAG: hypothetical protein C7B44_00275 [Sulfobacillus thermosulfidooxidans]
MNNPLTWPLVLETTGYLSSNQAQHYFDLALVGNDWPADCILWNDALWTRAQFQRGAHAKHRELITESFIRLYPVITHWQTGGTPFGLFPDAMIRMSPDDLPILIEVDTGKETAKQWQSKLAMYRLEAFANPPFGLWVIAAGGPRRINHLTTWVNDANLPLSWQVSPLLQLPEPFCVRDKAPIPPRLAALSEHPRYRMWPEGTELTGPQAQILLRQGAQIHAKEITALGPLYYLTFL